MPRFMVIIGHTGTYGYAVVGLANETMLATIGWLPAVILTSLRDDKY